MEVLFAIARKVAPFATAYADPDQTSTTNGKNKTKHSIIDF